MTKVIKTDAEYQNALVEMENLMDMDPTPNTPEGDRLELLILLTGEYESKKYQFDLPDPIDAILFRMEQQGLTQRDLIPYLGSRSKVSEVLSRKRPLTLAMIRALHSGLGLPAKVLIQETDFATEDLTVDWERFPVKEMVKRGWIVVQNGAPQQSAEIAREFFMSLGLPIPTIGAALYRKSSHIRSERTMDEYALLAWTAYVLKQAEADPPPKAYRPGTVNLAFMRQVARLSREDRGPLLARDFLREHGIALIVEPHLPRTHLDGAAIMIEKLKNPVIGLCLRHDRLDNFWYCLMHELAHLALHFGGDVQFYDDLDLEEQDDPREREADELAGEGLIPQEEWKKSAASTLRSPQAAESLARKVEISPAIVAGRMRHEFKAYRLLNNLVGHGQVRVLFPEVNW